MQYDRVHRSLTKTFQHFLSLLISGLTKIPRFKICLNPSAYLKTSQSFPKTCQARVIQIRRRVHKSANFQNLPSVCPAQTCQLFPKLASGRCSNPQRYLKIRQLSLENLWVHYIAHTHMSACFNNIFITSQS
jgi:hypothetical protein